MAEYEEMIPCDVKVGRGKSEHSPLAVRGKR